MAFGFPFLDLRASVGVHRRLTIFAGYRGVYGFNYAGYAGVKLGAHQMAGGQRAVALRALGGYTYVPSRHDNTAWMAGGSGGFGELGMDITARSGKHALLIAFEARVSQVLPGRGPDYPVEDGKAGVLFTASFELGYELRLMRFASYFVALGVDSYPNTDGLWPAMLRVRTGVVVEL